MLIRHAQLAAFSSSVSERYRLRVIGHIREFFPEECEALGEEGTDELVRYGCMKASAHGFVSGRDVCRYIILMVAFGRDFDRAPEHPWAATILNDEASIGSPERMQRLYSAALDAASDEQSAEQAAR
jgi:hypothetical protein